MSNSIKQIIKNILKIFFTKKIFFSIQNNFTPIVQNFGIKFYGLFLIPYNRGETLLSKEPDMIAFIEDYVKDNDIYYDIGANIGVFSMYSAIKKNANVFAFEPESSNYFMLNKNISLNDLQGKVIAFNIAINNIDEFSFLNLKENIIPGKSGNTFKEELNEDHEHFTPHFKQGVFGISLDNFVYKYNNPCPNHIKIDVDGNEYKVINGMKRVLNDSNLKTLAIEINTRTKRDADVLKVIKDCNFIKVDGYQNTKYEQIGIINYFFKKL
jgi:FkbM family methyltransferase